MAERRALPMPAHSAIMPSIEAISSARGASLRGALRLALCLPALALVAAGWVVLAGAQTSVEADLIAAYGAGAGATPSGEDPLLAALRLSLCGVPAGGMLSDAAAGFGLWLAMAGAMMLPCALPAWRVMVRPGGWFGGYAFLTGYGIAWLPLAAIGASLDLLLFRWFPFGIGAVASAAMLGFGALWRLRLSRIAERSNEGVCPADLRAERALRQGLRHGASCVVLDGPAMLAMAIAGAMSLPAMALVGAAMLAGRLVPLRRSLDPGALALGLLAVSALAGG